MNVIFVEKLACSVMNLKGDFLFYEFWVASGQDCKEIDTFCRSYLKQNSWWKQNWVSIKKLWKKEILLVQAELSVTFFLLVPRLPLENVP